MKRLTKRDLALSLHAAGRGVDEIARTLETHPSYVANVLAAAGVVPDYADLYVATDAQNGYARQFQGILKFKDVEVARESVRQIGLLYDGFRVTGDRRGMHHAQLIALVGKNRAEGVGKLTEAQVFADWLKAHLDVVTPEPTETDISSILS